MVRRAPPATLVGLCLLLAGALVLGHSASAKQAEVVASSPIAAAVEAAAAAALGSISGSSASAVALGDDNGPKLGSSVSVSTSAETQTTGAPATKVVSVIAQTQTTSAAPQQVGALMVHKLHKHINGNKKISAVDKLHKFDLFIDPVCERLAKLNEKQLNKVYLQLKQFSLHVSSREKRLDCGPNRPVTNLSATLSSLNDASMNPRRPTMRWRGASPITGFPLQRSP